MPDAITEPAGIIDLSAFDLLISGGLIVMVIGLSLWQNLGIHRSIIIGAIRTTLQLIVVGYILGWVFSIGDWHWVVVILLIMVAIGAWTVYSRQGEKKRPVPFWAIAISLFVGSLITLVIVQYLVIRISPWYEPQYLIPIFGMIVGNALTAVALCLSTLTGSLKDNADEIEQRLALGASRNQAASRHVQSSLKAALMPIINSMMVMGIVQLPGMMTGQILAGANPITAVKYQIVVMFMILAANAFTTVIAMNFSMGKFFTPAHQLRREAL